jgi:predicted branched-subunit amino acid permease
MTGSRPNEVTFSRAGFARGFRRGHVLAIGVFVYGIAFGIVADQVGLSTLQALLFSAVVYSGSAQLAALGVMSAGVSSLASTAWAILALILVINARYVLFGAALRPWLGSVSPWQSYPSLYLIGDGNWLLSMRAYDAGERDAGFVLGMGINNMVFWLSGTVLGHLGGNLAPNPRLLGLDFLLVAFAGAMMIGMFRSRADLAIVLTAAVVAALTVWLGMPSWAPVAAGLAGGAVAYLRMREEA